MRVYPRDTRRELTVKEGALRKTTSFHHAGDHHRRHVFAADSRNQDRDAARAAELCSSYDCSVVVVAPFVPKRIANKFSPAQVLALRTKTNETNVGRFVATATRRYNRLHLLVVVEVALNPSV